MDSALSFLGLTKRFPGFALQDVSLAIPRGAITGLVGANGAGKSTLLKLALGLLEPEAGEVRLFGEALGPSAPRLRARVGFVQESPTLPGHLRAEELGTLMAPFYPTWDGPHFWRLLADLEVPAKTPFRRLSQGNRMKLALALALAHHPDLLLLDEPTSGLDPLARRQCLDLLLEVVQDERRAVLFSTHITSDLDRVADHVALLQSGRLVLSGAKEDLLSAWRLVKGGEELLELLPHAGGQRTELGLALLCPVHVPPPPGAVVERLRVEDLLFYLGRPLDPMELPCTP